MSTIVSPSDASSILNQCIQSLRTASEEYRTVHEGLWQIRGRLTPLWDYGIGETSRTVFYILHGLELDSFQTAHDVTNSAVRAFLDGSTLPSLSYLSTNAFPRGNLLEYIEKHSRDSIDYRDRDILERYAKDFQEFKSLLARRDKLQDTIDRLILELGIPYDDEEDDFDGDSEYSETEHGVDPEYIATFPKVAYGPSLVGGGEKGECPICKEDVKVGDEVVLVPKCGHWFCTPECIGPWLRAKSTCPTCRRGLKKDATS